MGVMKLILLIYILVAGFTGSACADGEVDGQNQEPDRRDKEISHPGQVLQDHAGNKIKRWSTKGPVAVSEAPQPFGNQESSKLPSGTFINVLPKDNFHQQKPHKYQRKLNP